MAGVKISPSSLRGPLIGKDGRGSKEFVDFLYQLWDRSGGNDDAGDYIIKMMLSGAGKPADTTIIDNSTDAATTSLADILLSGQKPAEDIPVGLLHAFPGTPGWLGELQKALDEGPQRVVLTQPGGSSAEDGASTWARLMTFYAPAARSTGTWVYTLMGGNSYAAPICRFMVRIRNNNAGTGIQTSYTSIELLELFDEAGLSALTGLYIVAPVDGVGVDIELWMQKPLNNQHFALFEHSHFLDSGVRAKPNDNAAWQSTDPTSGAAIALAADWAGYPGPQSSSSFSSLWAGTCNYEKQATGAVIAGMVITTVGTIADGTTVFTMPATYRPATGVTVSAPYFDTAGSQGGRFTIDSNGAVKCYGLTGAPVAAPTGQFVYIARN